MEISPTPCDFFPLPAIREKQTFALEFGKRAFDRNYRNIVIEAPTGTGKASMGVALAFWAAGQDVLRGNNSAYYLVTQKMLQDQLEEEFRRYKPGFTGKGKSLKTAAEYACPSHGTCAVGRKAKKPHHCLYVQDGSCTYGMAKAAFLAGPVSVTNYPYFFTERTFVGEFEKRRVLIMDECHSVERQLLSFVELRIDTETVKETAPRLLPIPDLPTLDDFIDWVEKKYLKVLHMYMEAMMDEGRKPTRDQQQRFEKYEKLMGQITVGLKAIQKSPHNWVYWQDEDENRNTVCNAKPIDASPFADKLLFSMGGLRVFMSAYAGPKDVFCRSLGLDPEEVAWAKLGSTFPVENRPIHLLMLGSMGRQGINDTLPRALQVCENVLDTHANDRGVIHCGSYKLGLNIYNRLMRTRHASRILFPKKADERDRLFNEHGRRPRSVLISPSMTEGFDLKDDLARFQVIAKVQFPYLGDPQVMAKKDRDPDWYSMQAVMSIIQAVGRGVRSDTDHCVTYVLDSDFKMLYDRNRSFFPKWFESAFVWRPH